MSSIFPRNYQPVDCILQRVDKPRELVSGASDPTVGASFSSRFHAFLPRGANPEALTKREFLPAGSNPTQLTDIVWQAIQDNPLRQRQDKQGKQAEIVYQNRVETIENLALNTLNQSKSVLSPQSREELGLTEAMDVRQIPKPKWNLAFKEIEYERAVSLLVFFGYVGKKLPAAKAHLESLIPGWEHIGDLMELEGAGAIEIAKSIKKWLRNQERLLEKIEDLELPEKLLIPPEIIYFPKLRNLGEIFVQACSIGDTEVAELLYASNYIRDGTALRGKDVSQGVFKLIQRGDETLKARFCKHMRFRNEGAYQYWLFGMNLRDGARKEIHERIEELKGKVRDLRDSLQTPEVDYYVEKMREVYDAIELTENQIKSSYRRLEQLDRP